MWSVNVTASVRYSNPKGRQTEVEKKISRKRKRWKSQRKRISSYLTPPPPGHHPYWEDNNVSFADITSECILLATCWSLLQLQFLFLYEIRSENGFTPIHNKNKKNYPVTTVWYLPVHEKMRTKVHYMRPLHQFTQDIVSISN